ncbi:MAG: L-2-amino-thiazoline-4-carboxylic acid hydrolase [Clostridia bacterium]|nr:L-2-amino-thiazoline-4-carboxylic acid hydrolase [Clostridia bacterium]
MNEFHHAFLSARCFARLKDSGVGNYEEIFLFALRTYGSQRGRRMAQRALRDGRPLDFASYRYYSEWSFTQDFLADAGTFFRETERGENYFYEVYDCPWNRVYQQLGLPDGALLYCRDLDRAIAHGFNPDLRYEVERFEDAPLLCRQMQFDAHLECDRDYPAPDPANKRDFTYHCGHVLAVFRRVLRNCLGTTGDEITAAVLSDFSERFGKAAVDCLLTAAEADFDVI